MNIMEAYEKALEAVEELKGMGVRSKVTPSKSRETCKREGDPLPREKWVSVTFYPTDSAQSDMIYEKATALGRMGMRFDTGGGCGERDWELDWSFKLTEGSDEGWNTAREVAERITQENCEKGEGA